MLTGYTFKSYGADNTCSSGGGSYVVGVPIDNVYSGNNKWTGTNEFKHKTIINDLSVSGNFKGTTMELTKPLGYIGNLFTVDDLSGHKLTYRGGDGTLFNADPSGNFYWFIDGNHGNITMSDSFFENTAAGITRDRAILTYQTKEENLTLNDNNTGTKNFTMLYSREYPDFPPSANWPVNKKRIIFIFSDNATVLPNSGVAPLTITNQGPLGRVGVGTQNPDFSLHVAGLTDISGVGYQYFSAIDILSGPQTLPYNFNISIKSETGVLAQSFAAISDKRIKENIIDIEDTNALNKLRLIQPKTYDYVDKLTRGNTNVIGFIAQEVKEVLPNAVSIIKDYVPNFMTRCKISLSDNSNIAFVETEKDLLWNSLHDSSGNPYIDLSGNASSDASGNKHFKIKLYDPSNYAFELNTLNIIDKTHFSIDLTGSNLIDGNGNFIGNSGSYLDENGNTIEYENEYFLYGQEVDDFHSLDKQAIFTVATAALQEVDRQQQADKIRITNLETQVEQLLHKIENLETENKKMRDRFEVIEDRLRKI